MKERLFKKISGIDWSRARDDVQRFLPHAEQEALRNWDKAMFLYRLERMEDT